MMAGMAWGKLAIFGDIWLFLRVRRKWWLAPMLIVFLLFGVLLVFAETSALAPFLYTFF